MDICSPLGQSLQLLRGLPQTKPTLCSTMLAGNHGVCPEHSSPPLSQSRYRLTAFTTSAQPAPCCHMVGSQNNVPDLTPVFSPPALTLLRVQQLFSCPDALQLLTSVQMSLAWYSALFTLIPPLILMVAISGPHTSDRIRNDINKTQT